LGGEGEGKRGGKGGSVHADGHVKTAGEKTPVKITNFKAGGKKIGTGRRKPCCMEMEKNGEGKLGCRAEVYRQNTS